MNHVSTVSVIRPSVNLINFEMVEVGSWFIFEGTLYLKVNREVSNVAYNSISFPHNIEDKDFKPDVKVHPVDVTIEASFSM